MSFNGHRDNGHRANGNGTHGAAPPALRHAQRLAAAAERIPPHSLEHEMCVLGSMLLDRSVIPEVLDLLRPEDFYRTDHRLVFEAVTGLFADGKPVDLVSVPEALRKAGHLPEVGGLGYLAELATSVPAASNAVHYAEVVRDRALLREMILAADEAVRAGYEAADDPGRVFERTFARFAGISTRMGPGRYVGISAAELARKEFPGTLWIVDELLCPGLTLWCGKPKTGKSFAMLNIAVAVAAGGPAFSCLPTARGDVLYLALEDSESRLQRRLLATLNGGAGPENLWFHTDWPALSAGGARAIERWLDTHPAARLVIVDVFSKVRDIAAANTNAYQQEYREMAVLKKIADARRVALVLIHHTRKAEAEEVFDEISGTQALAGAADTSMVLRRVKGSRNLELHITGRDVDRRVMTLSHEPGSNLWGVVQEAEDDDGDAGASVSESRSRIVTALLQAAAPLSAKEVAQAAALKRSTVRSLLKRMTADGQVVRTDTGYQLPPGETPDGRALQQPQQAATPATGATAATGCETADQTPSRSVPGPISPYDPPF